MSVPTYAQPDQQQSRQSRRMFWIIIGGISIVVFIIFAAYVGFAAYSAINKVKQNGSIPERYYLNIVSGDYTQVRERPATPRKSRVRKRL